VRIELTFTVPDQKDPVFVLEVPQTFKDRDCRDLADTFAYLMSKGINDRKVTPKGIRVLDLTRDIPHGR
jgi:hypothetical protein